MSEALAESVQAEPQQTNSKHWLWKPGQSGNPKGRKPGTRQEFGQHFVEAVHADFILHGAEVIEEVREKDPTGYLKVCASLLPKELKITHGIDYDQLTDEQLRARVAGLLADFAALGIVIDGQAVRTDPSGCGQSEAAALPAIPEATPVP